MRLEAEVAESHSMERIIKLGSVIGAIGAILGAWFAIGGPLPALSSDIRRLDAKQADIAKSEGLFAPYSFNFCSAFREDCPHSPCDQYRKWQLKAFGRRARKGRPQSPNPRLSD